MKILLSIAVLLSCIGTTAQPRFTDSTFGNNGTIIQNTSLPNQYVIDVVLQPDGKSVTLAEADYNTVIRVVLIRYNTDGTLDASFNGDGLADSAITPNIGCYPSAIKLQPDGKLLVCGQIYNNPNAAFVIRYNTNGSLDASFGTNGILYLPDLTVSTTTTRPSSIADLVVLPNNKLMLLAGYNSIDTFNLKLIQLNPTGTIDSSFGTNGTVWLNTSPWSAAQYEKILLQADGKYVVGGNPGYSSSSPTASLILVRVNTNGTLDATYGTNGILTVGKGQGDGEQFRDMALQPDGKIIASGIGSSFLNTYQYTFVTRIATNGTLDASFAGSGTRYLLYTSNGFVSTEGQLSLQDDGKVLLAGGMADAGGFSKMAVARLTTAGVPDASFDGDGIATLQINQHASYGIASVQQADGSIVVSGYANNNNAASAAIARLTANGQTDNTVATAANIAYIGTGHDYEAGLNVHVQPADQKIIDLKERYNGVTYDLRVSRYLPNGTPDATFSSGGHTIIELPGSSNNTYSALLSNGKLMIVTLQTDYITNNRIELVRVNTNGRVDSSFGLNGRLLVPAGNNSSLVSNLSDVAFQPDDKVLLLTGQFDPASYTDSSFLIRLNPNGSLDATFSNTGRKYLASTSPYSSFLKIALQANGKIILAESRSTGPASACVITRLNTNGSTDNTFNGGTTALVPFINLWKMTVQPDDKIVLNDYTTVIFRLGSNGSPDATFGVGGRVDLSTYSPSFTYPPAVYALDSGKLLITGVRYMYQAGDTSFTQIMKLKANGSPDSSFGVNAVIQVDAVTKTYDVQTPLTVQTDGKLLLTGIYYSDTVTTNYGNAVLTRLKNGPSTGRLYTFTGSGLWSDPANWSDSTLPPITIPAGSNVVIDPPTGSECVIDITVHVQTGASMTIKAGKQVRLLGNLIIQ